MHKKQSSEDNATASALRVKSFFSSGKLRELSILFHQNAPCANMQSHHCNFIKIPRLPFLPSTAQMLKKDFTRTKKPGLDKAHLQAEKPFDLSIEEKRTSSSELKPERVRRWKLTEYLVAARKLRGWSKQAKEMENNALKKHSMSLIKEEDPDFLEEQKQIASWQDLIKSKEERQFHLTRIVKYFTQ